MGVALTLPGEVTAGAGELILRQCWGQRAAAANDDDDVDEGKKSAADSSAGVTSMLLTRCC
jgi:hypothetical protein